MDKTAFLAAARGSVMVRTPPRGSVRIRNMAWWQFSKKPNWILFFSRDVKRGQTLELEAEANFIEAEQNNVLTEYLIY